MAKAELGIILQDLRGKAGNAVFQKGKDGIVVRPRVSGSNPNTPAQQAVRAAFTKAAKQWGTFTANQVAGWNNYALTVNHSNSVNGKSYHPNGFNAFTELASKFYQANPTGTAPTTPPTTSFTGDTITVTAATSTGKVTFTASAANATNVSTEFFLQPLKNANRKPQKNGYRTKGYFHFASGTLTFDVTTPAGYYAAGYRFINTLTGQTSETHYLSVQQVTLSVEVSNTEKQRKAA